MLSQVASYDPQTILPGTLDLNCDVCLHTVTGSLRFAIFRRGRPCRFESSLFVTGLDVEVPDPARTSIWLGWTA